MKLPAWILVASISGVGAVGCRPAADAPQATRHEVNTVFVHSYTDAAISGAILAAHTIYPYHFVPNSRRLNELGISDLGVLAEHYSEHPGELNLHRGGTPRALYQARASSVMEALAKMGVDPARIRIADGLPGGDGMPSRQVVTIVEGGNDEETSDGAGAGASPGLEAIGSE